MPKQQMVSVFIVMFFMILTLMPVSAQTGCGALSQSDCDLIDRANQQFNDLQSAAFKLDFALAFTFEEGFFFEPIEIRLILDGAYARVEPTTTTGNDALQGFERGLDAVNSDVSVLVELPEIFGELLLPDMDNLLTLDLRLVDGIGYANFDKVLAGLNTSDIDMGWYGVDILDFAERALENPDIFGLNPADFLMPVPTEDLSTGGSLNDISEVRRLRDIEQNGQTMAVFENILDYAQLFGDSAARDDFADILFETMQSQVGTLYTDEELRQATENYLLVLDTIDMQLNRVIGLDDGHLHTIEFFLTFNPSEAPESAFSEPDPYGLALLQNINYSISMTLNMSQFDAAATTSAPEDATILPFEDFLPLLLPGSPT